MPVLENFELQNDTNEALPEVQKREIYAMISKRQESIASIDAEMDTLRFKRCMEIARIEVLKSIVSPIKEIPNEILAKIFVHYTRNLNSTRWLEYDVQFLYLPWRLAMVSSRWREVALSTGELWNNLAIQIPPSDSLAFFLKRTTEAFVRSGKWPISLSIRQNKSSSSVTQLLPLITQNAARLRHLVLHLNNGLWPILECPGGLLSTLQSLDVHLDARRKNTNNIDTLGHATIFENSPNLLHVSITTAWSGWTENFHPVFLRLPWFQLTQLVISPNISLLFSPAYDLLSQCNSLVDCSLCIPRNKPNINNLPIITLQYLKNLTISGCLPGNYGQFLGYLTVPSLIRLSISVGLRVHLWSRSDIVGLIVRSACRIEALKVSPDMPEDTLLGILEKMPYLKRLSTGETEWSYQRMIQGTFLPNLQLFECVVPKIAAAVNKVERVLQDFERASKGESTCPSLTIILVPIQFSRTRRDDLKRLGVLQRSWLRVQYRGKQARNFVDYSEREYTGSGYESSSSSSDSNWRKYDSSTTSDSSDSSG